MRAQPSISPLTLGICCATIAGALALAPGRGPLPDGPLRGADVMALEVAGSSDGWPTTTAPVRDEVDGDGTGALVVPDGPAMVPPSSARGLGADPSCTGDCDEAPTVLSVAATPTDVAGDRAGAEDRQASDASSEEPSGASGDGDTEDRGTGVAGVADATVDGASEDHSCRSPRAGAASPRGQSGAAEPSPCSRGRGHDGCRGSDCTDGRSMDTAQA